MPSSTNQVLWVLLSGVASLLLVATTNHMSQDVAVVPFLWIVPLSLYLLSFIICFGKDSWYWRPLWYCALWIGLGTAAFAYDLGVGLSIEYQIGLYSAALFACCMFCHGELVALKPGPRHLSRFYLLISVGGALGGIFVTLVAPAIFNGFWEYPGGLMACALLYLFVVFRDERFPFPGYDRLAAWLLLGGLTALLGRVLGDRISMEASGNIAELRNFYGVLRVEHVDVNIKGKDGYVLLHGRIRHGFQYSSEKLRTLPVSYFGYASGIGVTELALKQMAGDAGDHPIKTGVVGLGSGTIAAYGHSGDTIKFYEINPAVLKFSDRYFSYRRDSMAKIEIALGDARMTMEREKAMGQPQEFDVLAVDAFSGDAIPLHLLTRESFALYWYHLKPDGVLAIHITNRYLDLEALVNGLALDAGKEARMVAFLGRTDDNINACDWVLVTSNMEFLKHSMVESHLVKRKLNDPLVFTDDYSNLFKLLRD